MSSVIFSESFVTIAAIVLAVIFSSAVVVNIQQINNVQSIMTSSIKDKMETDVKIVFASISGELVYVYVKNIGVNSIPVELISRGDLYFGLRGRENYIPFNLTSYPTWNYYLINDVDRDEYLDPGETIELLIHLNETLVSGDYHVRYVTYNGVIIDYYFSI